MTVRPFRVAGVLAAGAVALTVVSTAPAFAQRIAGEDDPVAIAGSVPAWATGAARVADAPGQQRRTVQVALSLRDERGAEALATAISTPGSPQFGRHLSSTEFNARFAPTVQTVDTVRQWLAGKGLAVGAVAGNRHFVDVTGSVEQLQAAFGVRIGIFAHPGGKRLAAPEGEVKVPKRLRGAVTAVVGLDDSGKLTRPSSDLSRVVTAAAAAEDGKYCARYWAEFNNAAVPQKYPAGSQSNLLCGYTTPQLRAIYGQTAANTGAGQHVAITGSYNLASLEADTNKWAAESGATPLAPGQYTVVPPPDGYKDNPNCGSGPEAWNGEQAMDLQSVHALAPAAKVTWYAGSDCTDNYNALNRAIAENKASVISNSWNAPGENVISPAVRSQVDAMLVQAAIQGQAVLFSSGDTGDNTATVGKGTPLFPASHPWVTGVGGTTVALNADKSVKFTAGWETAGNTLTAGAWKPQSDADGPFAGGAGGGRSTLYAQPAYQRGVVPDAAAAGKRTVPDIAALSDAFTGFSIGYTSSRGWAFGASGGTSLGSPIMAALVANAQQARGVTRMGFLNGALYKLRANTAAILDVKPAAAGMWTPGMSAPGGVTVPSGPGDYLIDVDAKPQSLQSGPGWDPVTGVGTPVAGFVSALASR